MQDRNAVLQKSKMLRGINILISEDFPKNVLEKREQLVKFAKEVSEVVMSVVMCVVKCVLNQHEACV